MTAENRAFVLWMVLAVAVNGCAFWTVAAIRAERREHEQVAAYARAQDAALAAAERRIGELERQNRLLGAYVDRERAELNNQLKVE